MIDPAAAYTEVHSRMTSLVASLSPEQLRVSVPACPEWTVQDLVAHHTAVTTDLGQGTLSELGDLSRLLAQNNDPVVAHDRDAMTTRQVEERRGKSIDVILAEWSDSTAHIMPMLRGDTSFPEGIGDLGRFIAVNDVVVHEGDLHEALTLQPPPMGLATSLALAGYGFTLDHRVRQAGLPALAVAYDGKTKSFGDGAPAAVVSADRRTLVRLLASRIPPDQILELAWQGDPAPYLDVIPEYGPARPA